MAAKPVDFDHSVLVRLADHASKLLREFTELDDPADRQKMPELLAELEHLITEFRRLRPPPTFSEMTTDIAPGPNMSNVRGENQGRLRIIRDARSRFRR